MQKVTCYFSFSSQFWRGRKKCQHKNTVTMFSVSKFCTINGFKEETCSLLPRHPPPPSPSSPITLLPRHPLPPSPSCPVTLLPRHPPPPSSSSPITLLPRHPPSPSFFPTHYSFSLLSLPLVSPVTYPLLRNLPEWTSADGEHCSAWTQKHPNTCLLDSKCITSP